MDRPREPGATRIRSEATDHHRPEIGIRGDEATIEAGYLAGKLGLSVDRLGAEMRRGIVHAVAERGVGEDAGRTRLTFRHRARSWTVVVTRDGALDEAAAPRR